MKMPLWDKQLEQKAGTKWLTFCRLFSDVRHFLLQQYIVMKTWKLHHASFCGAGNLETGAIYDITIPSEIRLSLKPCKILLYLYP